MLNIRGQSYKHKIHCLPSRPAGGDIVAQASLAGGQWQEGTVTVVLNPKLFRTGDDSGSTDDGGKASYDLHQA